MCCTFLKIHFEAFHLQQERTVEGERRRIETIQIGLFIQSYILLI